MKPGKEGRINMRVGQGYTIEDRSRAQYNQKRKSKAASKGRGKKSSMSDSLETEDESPTDVENVKTASLKDLFKVSITSSLPVTTIKSEVKRVLKGHGPLVKDYAGDFQFHSYSGRNEIVITVSVVRIPLLSLHGVRFKRTTGTKENYEFTLNTFLEELRLALKTKENWIHFNAI